MDVCVEISDVPVGGADCDITVFLASIDGVKAGELTVQGQHAFIELLLLNSNNKYLQSQGRTLLHLIHWRWCSWQTWFPVEIHHVPPSPL